MEKVKLQDIDLVVGEPLEYDIFDARGWMLLNRDYVLTSSVQIERLLERGAYGTQPEVEAVRRRRGIAEQASAATLGPRMEISVFDRVTRAKSDLEARLSNPAEDGSFAAAICAAAKGVQQCVELDADVAIANLFLNPSGRYPIRHAFNTALVCELVSRASIPDAQARLPVVCAALTMDLTIMHLEDLGARPSDADQRACREHPAATEMRLRELGVADGVWLTAVGQHHERPNGSGYPQGLRAGAIAPAAQTLGLAEEYVSLVTDRKDRPAALPAAALRELFADRQGTDTALAAILVQQTGSYPPGVLVRLKNGDLAMVLRRTRNAQQPVVRALVNVNRRTLDGYPKRLTSRQAFIVEEVVALAKLGRPLDRNEEPLQLESLWDSTSAAMREDGELELARDALTR